MFVYANNLYGYDKVLYKNLTKEAAIRLAKKLSRDAWRRWQVFSIPHNNRYEVYEDDQDPDIDEPIYSIK